MCARYDIVPYAVPYSLQEMLQVLSSGTLLFLSDAVLRALLPAATPSQCSIFQNHGIAEIADSELAYYAKYLKEYNKVLPCNTS